jgi:hypothetical protein
MPRLTRRIPRPQARRCIPEARGIRVQALPETQRNIFIRSDQYNFIRHRLPAPAMEVVRTF